MIPLAHCYCHSPSRTKAKKKTHDAHGLDPKWQKIIQKRAARRTDMGATAAVNDDSMVQFGSIIPEGETDKIEAMVIKSKTIPNIVPPNTNQSQYLSIKIEPSEPKMIKEACGSAKKWLLDHLGNKEVQDCFTFAVVPRSWKKLSALNPWENLTVDDIKEIINEVFRPGIYTINARGAWMGLATACMHNYRNGFSKHAMDTIDLLISGNEEQMNTKDAIADEIAYHLQKVLIHPESDLYTFAFHWSDWSKDPAEWKGFGLNQLVLRTFALAHFAHLDGIDDFTDEKPIGALIYSMQAVGRVLEHWKSGEKSGDKVPAFSSDNFGDTWEDAKQLAGAHGKVPKKCIRRATIFVQTLKDLDELHWAEIIQKARMFVPGLKKGSDRKCSSSTTVAGSVDNCDEDPDANFKMAMN